MCGPEPTTNPRFPSELDRHTQAPEVGVDGSRQEVQDVTQHREGVFDRCVGRSDGRSGEIPWTGDRSPARSQPIPPILRAVGRSFGASRCGRERTPRIGSGPLQCPRTPSGAVQKDAERSTGTECNGAMQPPNTDCMQTVHSFQVLPQHGDIHVVMDRQQTPSSMAG